MTYTEFINEFGFINEGYSKQYLKIIIPSEETLLEFAEIYPIALLTCPYSRLTGLWYNNSSMIVSSYGKVFVNMDWSHLNEFNQISMGYSRLHDYRLEALGNYVKELPND